MHDLINRAGWKDVVIVYSYEEGKIHFLKKYILMQKLILLLHIFSLFLFPVACSLTAKLHNSGIKTRIVKEENIHNFQWEFYHSKQGHILLSVNDTQLNWSIYILKV